MLVDLPLDYTAEVRMPRGKKFDPVRIKHTHTIKIAEPDEDNAPIVCRRTVTDYYGDATPPVEIIRHYEGKFWRSLRKDARASNPADHWFSPETFAEVISSPNSGDSDHPVPFRSYSHVKEVAFDSTGATGAAEIRKDDLEDVVAAVNRRADNFIIIDGVVYTKTSEPVYVYSGREAYQASYLETELQRSKVPARIYRIDQFDELLARAFNCEVDGLHEALGDELDEHEKFRPEVLLPGVLEWDARREAVRLTIGNVVEGARSKAADMDVETFEVFAQLRDRDFEPAQDEAELEVRAELVVQLIEMVNSRMPSEGDWRSNDKTRASEWLADRQDNRNDIELIGAAFAP